jgi:hypothetical protein
MIIFFFRYLFYGGDKNIEINFYAPMVILNGETESA